MSDGGLQEIVWSESSGVACYFAIVGKLPEKFCLGGGGGGGGGSFRNNWGKHFKITIA